MVGRECRRVSSRFVSGQFRLCRLHRRDVGAQRGTGHDVRHVRLERRAGCLNGGLIRTQEAVHGGRQRLAVSLDLRDRGLNGGCVAGDG